MLIYQKYITKTLLKYILISWIGFSSLAFLFALIAELLTTNGTYNWQHCILVILWRIPIFLRYSFSIAALLGSILAVSSLSKNNELTTLRTAGLSIPKIFGLPLLIFLPIIVVIIYFGGYIAATSHYQSTEYKNIKKYDKPITARNANLWFKEENAFFIIKGINNKSTGEVSSMEITHLGVTGITAISTIKNPIFDKNTEQWSWKKENRSIVILDSKNANLAKIEKWKPKVNFKIISNKITKIEFLTPAQLYYLYDYYAKIDQPHSIYGYYFYNILTEPILIILLMFLGIALAVGGKNTNTAMKSIIGVVSVVGVQYFQVMLIGMAHIYAWSKLVVPSIVFMIVILALYFVIKKNKL